MPPSPAAAGPDSIGARPDLQVERVSKRYGSFTAVDDLSLDVARGSFFSILGPSGCGKTTLMLVGSDSTLTVIMYGRMREGATPVLNAVSLFLMLASSLLALAMLRRSADTDTPARPREPRP